MRHAFALAAAALLLIPIAHAALGADAGLRPRDLLVGAADAGPRGARDAPTLEAALLDHYALLGAVPTPEGLARLRADLALVPPGIQAPVARLLAAMDEAARMRHEAFAAVSVEDARFASAATLREGALSPEETARLEEVAGRIDVARMRAAARLTLDAVEAARDELRLALAQGARADVAFVDPLGSVEIAGDGPDLHVQNRTLLVDLGGNDEWQNNAGASMPDFVIEAFPGCVTTGGLDCTPLDPGRNGRALESVFGRPCSLDATRAPFVGLAYAEDAEAHADAQSAQPSLPALQRFLLSADHPTQRRAAEAVASPAPDARCLPDAQDPEAWREDFVTRGILGDGDEHVVAVALDLGGDDRFAPTREFNDINDGDNAAGCDTRPMGEAGKLWSRNLTAGSAFAGVGILWDAGGHDFYGGRSLAQGAGHVGGVGILVDEGRGNDEYVAVRLSQAVGVFVALGMIYDDGGDDRYALENDVPFFNEFEHFIGCDVSTRDGQGRANFNGVGILADLAGNDAYFVQAHDAAVPGATRDDPTTTQGSTGTRLQVGPSPVNGAAALGLGLLWDADGTDSYSREGRGDDRVDAKGVFVDGRGLSAPPTP